MAGAAAGVIALTALPAAAQVPFGLLGLDALMAWGLLSALQLATRKVDPAPGDGWVLALGSFLPLPFLARLLAAHEGLRLPLALRFTWLLEVLVLGTGLVLLVALHRGATHQPFVLTPSRLVALGGAGLSVALLGLVLRRAVPLDGAWAIWGATALACVLALLAQRAVGRRVRGTRFEVFGSAAALFLAATQLLDGVVSYLSVRDPLGVLAVNFYEQVAVSAWLLQTTGPGYALAKWLLALGVVYAIDGRSWPGRPEPASRVALYLVVGLVGLGPGLFSATRLLG